MALFKTAEEKAELEAEKINKLLSKYGLQNLKNQEDINSVRKIAEELTGTGFLETGIALGGGSEKDVLKNQLYYQRAMLEQNFIIIRQLDRLNSLLNKN